jgi:hypothetical protein
MSAAGAATPEYLSTSGITLSIGESEGRVSNYFDAVVVAAEQADLIDWLEDPLFTRFLTPINLELYQVGQGQFVVFGWRAGAARPAAWGELQNLAYRFSLEYVTAVAVHYDDQVSEMLAVLARGGEPLHLFGEADEVWVPYGEDGELVKDGPRYPGDALPVDIECDCIWNGIDAALAAAEFQGWLTCRKLVEVAYQDNPIWRRPGVVG